MGTPMEDASKVEKWLLHVDGPSTTQGSSAGIVITSPYGEDLEFAVKFGFKASNNEAKYELIQIPMEEIVKADCLSKLVSALEDCRTRHITIQHLPKPRAPLNVQEISSIEDWRTPMSRWLEEGHLPPNSRCYGAYAGTWDTVQLSLASRLLLAHHEARRDNWWTNARNVKSIPPSYTSLLNLSILCYRLAHSRNGAWTL
ncbi:UNVERIFIED_CONTAM: hypothetical protein Scaly_2731900 [Sesamum calycinum]|uniref:Uncharacterized protein n=1 Tax=Sesamum calycinum TaxID=2727403 RepID=A0AAW2J1P7_9LAMI